MKIKSTSKALIMSAISMLLTVLMLVGTTFAWFTDSVTSANNVIKAGNLDIELQYLDAEGNWATVGEDTNVFMENALWEPGHTEVVYLKISNEGSLAFDYKISVNVASEITSINVFDDELRLSDYIMMGAVEDRSAEFDSRDAAIGALDQSKVLPIQSGFAAEGTLYPAANIPEDGASVKYMALVVYMPESVGNEANHKLGEATPVINLGINLLATQDTYEADSFGNTYDEGALTTVPTVPMAPETLDLTVYDVFGADAPTTELTGITLNIYSFIAEQYVEAYPLEEYGDWTCDFFVSTDAPVEEGLILAGSYGSYSWLGFWVPANDQPYDPVGLLGVVSYGGESNWSYVDIHDDVQIFRCGLIDYYGNNAGVKVTVDLRMTSPDKTQTEVVRRIEVILGE